MIKRIKKRCTTNLNIDVKSTEKVFTEVVYFMINVTYTSHVVVFTQT